jgi:hypothetical protein
MKKIYSLHILFWICSTTFAQTNKLVIQNNTDDKIVEINTDISFNSGDDNSKATRTGNGYLGISFIDRKTFLGSVYGDVSFSVYSTNDNVFTLVGTQDKSLFGKSLLIPQNGAEGINSFSVEGGIQEFILKIFKKKSGKVVWESINRRVGIFASYKASSLNWEYDNVKTDLFINSFSGNINIVFFEKELSSLSSTGKAAFSGFLGISSRRIGGNYGQNSFKNSRQIFLNTDKLGFAGIEYGFRLDVDKFYGRMSVTSFSKNVEITGFSGHQFLITLGIKSGFKISK